MNLNVFQILSGLLFAAAIAYYSYRLKALSASGAISAVLIGTIIFGLGGIIFAIPLLFFFISSSFLSKITNPAKSRLDRLHGYSGPRDYRQVLANGGTAALFVIAFAVKGNYVWFIPYLASLCESTADTWGTEIGTLSKSQPISLRNFTPVDSGQSGAVSILGTFGALIGASATMLAAYYANSIILKVPYFPISVWAISAFSGFAGSILDSILGATAQAVYRCPKCQKITESRIHCATSAYRQRGLPFIGNNTVNFISSLGSALLAAWLLTNWR